MDNTELHYVTYDPKAIWNEMMYAYVMAGGDILYPGDEKDMLLRSVQADIVQVLAGVDNALRMHTLRYAVGEYLDILGELRSCPRIEATAATATVTIAINATGRADVLPAGTGTTCDGEIYYLLTEDLIVTGYEQTVTATVVADRTGSIGNGLVAGTEMQLVIGNGAIAQILVATDATGGNDEEDDDTYRERIRQNGLVSVSTGPAKQYESVAKSVSSEIVDAKALNLGAGNVGVYLILSTNTGVAGILQQVLDALSAEDVRPLTDSVSVYEATNIPYTLNVKYQADNSSAFSAAIAEAVNDYQEWQDGTIGRPFNPDRLMAALYQAGCTRVIWGEGSHFNTGGSIEYTEIASNARCKGTIALIAL